MNQTEYNHPDTPDDREASVRRKNTGNIDVLDETVGRTILLGVVGQERKVVKKRTSGELLRL